ncbi:MAG TPA: SOSS complex subunit B family protein [archaeon]|nr:SOSS complex subunit B family protein [archaeon]
MKIKDLKPNQTATLDDVEVVEAGEVREFNKYGKSGRVCTLKLKDASGQVELTLWNEDVDKFAVGDKLKITDGWVKEWNGNTQISSGKNGKIEKI